MSGGLLLERNSVTRILHRLSFLFLFVFFFYFSFWRGRCEYLSPRAAKKRRKEENEGEKEEEEEEEAKKKKKRDERIDIRIFRQSILRGEGLISSKKKALGYFHCGFLRRRKSDITIPINMTTSSDALLTLKTLKTLKRRRDVAKRE